MVDNDSDLVSFLHPALEEEGHRVDVAYRGADGEYLAALNPYDVLLLDCLLPDKDGRQVCRDLRGLGITTPALLISVRDSTADKILGFNSGADDYLTKPFDFNELLARVRALGRRKQPPRPRSLDVTDLRIDPATRRVRRADREITLTAKEYKLLELLARSAGRVVTRRELVEWVWGTRHDSTANNVDVLVKHLRDKIDRNFEPRLILTVRGVGYTIQIQPKQPRTLSTASSEAVG